MPPHSSRRPCFCLLVAALMLLPLGCRKGKSASANPKVELSDVQITILEPQKARLSVKYRFTEGRPLADKGYFVMVTVSYLSYGEKGGNTAFIKKTGESLATEGTLQDEFGLFKPAPPEVSIAYELVMRQGDINGQFGDFEISNTLKGTTR